MEISVKTLKNRVDQGIRVSVGVEVGVDVGADVGVKV
jgi:hypothetical protein